jgi:hypothetical protein
MEGNLVGSDEKNIKGETAFRWLAGGFFLEQRVQIDFMGLQIDSLELRIRTTRIPPSNSAVEPGASSAASTFVPSASATLTGSARS